MRSRRFRTRRTTRRSSGADLLPLNVCRAPLIVPPGSCQDPFIQATPLLLGNTAPGGTLTQEALTKGLKWRGCQFDYAIGSTTNQLDVGTNVVVEIRWALIVMEVADPVTLVPSYLPDLFQTDQSQLGTRLLMRWMDYYPINGQVGADNPEQASIAQLAYRSFPMRCRSRVNLREDQAIYLVQGAINPVQDGTITFGWSLFGFHAVKPWVRL